MISIVAGTNRRGSKSGQVARFVEQLYRQTGEETVLLDLVDMPPACLEPEAYGRKPASFEKGFVDPVLASAGMVLVVPEYNGSFPGALKLFIDLLPFPEAFDKRPVCFIGLSAGQWGALRAVEQLQMIFGYRNAFVFNQRVFLPGAGKLFPDGVAPVPEEIVQRLERQADGFSRFVRSVEPLR